MDRLINRVRAYGWGSATAIPELLGATPTGEPQAELWMGAHPGDPSRVDRGAGPRSLVDVIAADPVDELGAATAARFGAQLPFLFKVLAVDKPLSLQVHPNAAQAAAGFADEDARGIPREAPFRNYVDANHKPELACALTDLEALCGFREVAATVKLLDLLGVPELQPCADALRERPESEGLRSAMTQALTLPDNRKAAVVGEVASACLRVAGTPSPFAAACLAVADLARRHPADLGVVAALLLNHMRLTEGQAVYFAAGLPHSYLSGTFVEILANSDNVLRCGLTDKHIDVAELLRVLEFRAGPVDVLAPIEGPDGEQVYHTPVPDFRLSRYVLDGGAARLLPDGRPQILLCTAGGAKLAGAHGTVELARGQSVYVPASDPAVSLAGDGLVFRATVPSPNGAAA
ncbi:mannose-6-phosphate isomerase, class I [Yinghuangia seranimata]|uniref:mannose-6-phosphate isomerase, class I n=1 Tax=Yinghuangia seranimata TaxID=408067 RepID=UPI00248C678F|nr:mannose-6-phosphate isomerase, class I [Yinghuangia seranimata]MDI2132616.1 mannose-6-phosphate isomerase, class I [Yinghuangia seranimata]